MSIISPAAYAEGSCPYKPNYYAGGTDTASSSYGYGVDGFLPAHSESVSDVSQHFTDVAVHVVTNGNGLEVGWYFGWGDQTDTYVTSPHLYATLNGPDEVDGPAISTSSDYEYSTEFFGSTYENYDVFTSAGSYVWDGDIEGASHGPGLDVALGEADVSGLPIGTSAMTDLEDQTSSYATGGWPGLTACQDSGYTGSKRSNTAVTVSGG